MQELVGTNEWKLVQESWVPTQNKAAESLFSIGNGRMGQRANFEENFSGDTLQGHYIGGIYYPDKTRVGWWKNGYPESFAKVLNAPAWIGLKIEIDGELLDLAQCEINSFYRELNMQEGTLLRKTSLTLPSGKKIAISSLRFCAMQNSELGVLQYKLKALNFNGEIGIASFVDADVRNEDANYDEVFWEEMTPGAKGEDVWVTAQTRKTAFGVCTASRTVVEVEGKSFSSEALTGEKWAGQNFRVALKQGEELSLLKFAAVTATLNHPKEELIAASGKLLEAASLEGFEALLEAQKNAWEKIWAFSDIKIEGDISAQQAIRFCIFQLNQTYTGEDERLNIGPKGFTGEKYGGSTYWDTEAFCFPFYLATADPSVAQQLLVYRYKQLDKAIQNAEKLGFKDGAALYPMVTMNGEECHNEWEITFEEIHRNGAIAFAIFNYIRYTGDQNYLAKGGFEVLLAISRFWAQRVNYSEHRQKYVMLGVTGPNEYENNVNNNWYTNKMACWTLEYTLTALDYLKDTHPETLAQIKAKTGLDVERERSEWIDIMDNMHLPKIEGSKVFLQQDGFLDKDQALVSSLSPEERPINQHWSWDRILRSCFIKQADVVQGLYVLEDQFDLETIRENYAFYEPRTVHESSLSPSIHAVIASKLGNEKQAYEMYLRTARLDLDDYNKEVHEGLHITSMAGSWLAIVEGFGGMRVKKGVLHFRPFLPGKWTAFSFKVLFRGTLLSISIAQDQIEIANESTAALTVMIFGNKVNVSANGISTQSMTAVV